ncbi:alpha/beta fold hydrolase [Mycobacterium bourgelatii]|uniref:Alpha/beta hydrolase n=1 Tax=Mycobacterium bourgelatii TaxID=1273442 RepID=A0A7I9YKB8_MYCBU|nr:alpha/beta hydrolase [Mycobacterium bourgelatii]MCV6974657.1 alpha/beta hydrolase [Mycobacterium bourgelatii]GFG89124.1 alpha/beta hydrolase [Mycobacterium bourgelatii]
MEINGGSVVYELLGEAGELIVLTPGGRFSKDSDWFRPLADGLVAGGKRVLLWDRPNCGRSDVQFFGPSESHMRADTLYELLTRLVAGPCVLAGGSSGARDSMLTAILYPEVASKLVLWNIVGGIYGSFFLGSYYVIPSIVAVRGLGGGGIGMAALLNAPEWQERIAANPNNRQRLLDMDSAEFLKVMKRWLNAYVPKTGQAMPGVDDEMFERITVPTLIFRGSDSDWDHPRRTSLDVSCLIKGSLVVDPPWPDDYWLRAAEKFSTGEAGRFTLFDNWVLLVDPILEFLSGHQSSE